MIPVGYMAKQVARQPDWLNAVAVSDIYSVSNCISEDFADYINAWKHNGFWLFNSPSTIEAVAAELSASLEDTKLFYYEVYELEYDQEHQSWSPFEAEQSFDTQVVPPTTPRLEGYDVVSFFVRTSPECSPLSCNGLASSFPVNSHCLLPSIEQAIQLV